MESISLNSFVLLEHLAIYLTSTLSINRFARASSYISDLNTLNKLLTQNFLNKSTRILNFAKPFLNFIDDTMILYLNSKLDFNLA